MGVSEEITVSNSPQRQRVGPVRAPPGEAWWIILERSQPCQVRSSACRRRRGRAVGTRLRNVEMLATRRQPIHERRPILTQSSICRSSTIGVIWKQIPKPLQRLMAVRVDLPGPHQRQLEKPRNEANRRGSGVLYCCASCRMSLIQATARFSVCLSQQRQAQERAVPR